jgi:Lrp/AsnC family leucine-responsive transcriptional regulator
MKEKIISELRKNSRQTLTDMSLKTGIPVTTLFSNIKRLEKDEIIKKNTCLVDFHKLGYTTAVSIALKIEKEDRERFKNFILSEHSVNSAYEINSGFDFMFELIHKDHSELKHFIEKMEENFKIKEKHVYHFISTLRKEDFLTHKEKISEQFIETQKTGDNK